MKFYQNGPAQKLFAFAHKLLKPLAALNETCRVANVLKMSNMEHFPTVEPCIMW
jgi:hypothetical protein